jgi:hypothetical protein
MSIDARTYADSAVAQGKSALAHAGTALGQAGVALGVVNRRLLAEAPKPVYAALGAADLVASSVTKRAEELPTEAVQGVSKAQQTGQALIGRAQSEASTRLGELRERIAASRQTASTLPGTARVAGETYLQAAKGIYASLTDRGEARAAELRQNPRVAKLLGQAGETAGEVRDTVAPLAKSAFDAVAEPTDTEPTVAELPAKSAARKPAAAKATGAKATGAKKATSTRKTSTTKS